MSCTPLPVWAKQLTRLPCLVVYAKFNLCILLMNVLLTTSSDSILRSALYVARFIRNGSYYAYSKNYSMVWSNSNLLLPSDSLFSRAFIAFRSASLQEVASIKKAMTSVSVLLPQH